MVPPLLELTLVQSKIGPLLSKTVNFSLKKSFRELWEHRSSSRVKGSGGWVEKNGRIGQLSLDSNKSLGISGSFYTFGAFTITISGNRHTAHYIHIHHTIFYLM